ncbi:MAG: TIGR04283 family arsenosugar biosynthesis glycosyltransferase [Chryseolinea sp.]
MADQLLNISLPTTPQFRMKISVIIPTLNESEHIVNLIQFIQKFGSPHVLEIIVVDANSNDNTAALVAGTGTTILNGAVASRAGQMNQGSKVARGDVLYFIHADVLLVETFADDISQAVQEGFEAGCYQYAFNSTRPILKMMAYFNRFNGLMCRGGDQTLFITKKLFLKLNGFDEYYTIMEDYDLIRRIMRKSPFKVFPKRILVSARKYETNSWIRVQFANLTAFMMFYLRRNPSQIRKAYKKMLKYR